MDISIKDLLDSPSYQWQKDLLRTEINKARLEVDYSTFKKDQKERDAIKTMKLNTKVSKRPKTLVKVQF